MKVRSTPHKHTQIPKRDNLVVDNTIKIQTSSSTLNISQEGATLYSKYIQQTVTKVSQLHVNDIADMKMVQGRAFYANPYAKYLDESAHNMKYSA